MAAPLLRFHNGNTTATTAVVMYSTTLNADVSLSISGGTAVNSGRTNHYGAGYIATGNFQISGLKPDTDYIYTISQSSESYTGSFRTDPNNQATPFSIVLLTCNYWKWRNVNIYPRLRALAEQYENSYPIQRVLHIDDVTYVDTFDSSYNVELPNISGAEVQQTGLTADYAIAWATWHGHDSGYPVFTDKDFQWCLQNLSWCMSGGDHMFENNHCWGMIGNPDYSNRGCPRDPANTLPNLEANALTAWHAFIGNGNPPTLGSGTDLHWGVEIGPVRLALFDRNLYSYPFNGTDTTRDAFGATQLAAIRSYLNVSSVPFKCMLMETGWSRTGQPWYEWHTTEASAWKTQFDADVNMNSTSGWSFGMYGDYHCAIVQSFDKFWAFCPGTTGTSDSAQRAGPPSLPLAWGGAERYFWGGDNGSSLGEKRMSALLHLIVHADETPKRLEMRGIDLSGNMLFQYEMSAAPGNDNQWTNARSRRVSFGGGL